MENEQPNNELQDTTSDGKKSVYFKTIGRITLIFFVGFSIFLLFSTIILIFLTKPEREVEVPNVVGRHYTVVHNSLIRSGFRPILKFNDVHDIDSGMVLTQFPEPGSIISEGSTIKLTVSRSALTIDVPALTGIELPFALNKIKNLHINDRSVSLPLGVVSYVPSDTAAENIVLDQSPRQGEKVPLHRKINLLVSAGKKEAEMKMPDAAGQSVEFARTMLMARGLVVKEELSPTGDLQQSGLVSSQTPAKDTEVKSGDTITLNVNYYRMTDHPYYAVEMVQYTIPSGEKTGLYEAFVEDNKSKRLCFSRQMAPGQQLAFVFERNGNARITILAEKKSIKVMKIDAKSF